MTEVSDRIRDDIAMLLTNCTYRSSSNCTDLLKNLKETWFMKQQERAMLTGNLEKIAEHGRRADGIVKSMREHSRGETGERRSVDLNKLVEEALNLAYHGVRAQDQTFNITMERDLVDNTAPIELVPQDITRVCLNLFSNGFYAANKRRQGDASPGFKPTLTVTTRDLANAVEIRVRDNGIGIPPEIKDKLFQPFHVAGIVDNVGVVAGAAGHRVGAHAAVQPVIAGAAGDRIGSARTADGSAAAGGACQNYCHAVRQQGEVGVDTVVDDNLLDIGEAAGGQRHAGGDFERIEAGAAVDIGRAVAGAEPAKR